MLSRWITQRAGMMLGLMVVCMMLTTPAAAVPTADFQYVETALGGGVFQYNYTLFNQADPVLDAGFNIFDVFVSHPTATFSIVSLPADWDGFAGLQFARAFSLLPGADLPPGAALGGFVLQVDAQVGNIPFEVLFTNPQGPDPVPFSGITSPVPTVVPEPASLWLLGTAMVGIGVRGLARRRLTGKLRIVQPRL